jgi:putative colanic acid biosynthesis acetyltransferase WcaF
MLYKTMNLAHFSSRHFDRGRSSMVEALWMLMRVPVFASWNPSNGLRVALLKTFGARIGVGVIVKPGVKVKFPWRLRIGANSWIGENVWIDNLDEVTIGSNSCVSQATYLCTGNHDWKSPSFELRTAPIAIGNEVWVAARSTIGPGVTIGDRSIIRLASVVTSDVGVDTIFPDGKSGPATSLADENLC